MCLLTVFPMPDLLDGATMNRLTNGSNWNADGSGFAVVVGNRIEIGKSLSGDEAIDQFARVYSRATGPALFHSRRATHGGKNTDNVHPFEVHGLHNTYLAHNGIMPLAAIPEKTDPRSDTRLFADEFLAARWERLDSPKVRSNLENWLGDNKVAVLTTNRRYRRNLYVFGLSKGEWVDGVWFSNGDHSDDQYKAFSRHWAFEDKVYALAGDDCISCKKLGTVDSIGMCTECMTCQDCGEDISACDCYAPASAKRDEPDDADEDRGYWPSAERELERNAEERDTRPAILKPFHPQPVRAAILGPRPDEPKPIVAYIDRSEDRD